MLVAFPSTSILDSTAAGRSLLTAVDAAAQRSLLGLGTLATQSGNIADYLTIASAATTYQPLDSDLTAIAALTTTTYGRSLLTNADAPATRTTLGLGTGDSPTFQAGTLSGQTLTGSSATSLFNLSTTWNTTGTPTAILLDVTDTSSNASSNLIDLRVGGTSRFNVTKSGVLNLSSQVNAAVFAVSGGAGATINSTRIGIGSGVSIDFSSTASAAGLADSSIVREAVGILAQRNALTPQAFRLYNTFTDVNNFERGFLRWSSNVLQLGTEIAGTGTSRNLQLIAGGSARMTVDTAGRVGIDNVTPQTLLHVGAGSGALTIPNGVGGSITAQVLHSATSGSVAIACGIQDGTNNRRIGFFMNQTDGICGIGQTMSSGSIPFVITMAAERFRISPAGDVGISTNNPAARLHVKGSGNSSATFGLNVENSDGTHVFRVRDDGGFHIGPTTNSTNGAFISPSDGADNIGTTTLSGLRYRSSLSTSGSGSDHFFRNYQGSRTNTSGNANLMEFTGAFAPTSGTGIYNLLSGSITVNQTGGANGITRGLHINPILTAAADFRAIESVNGSVVLTDTHAAGSGSLAGSLLNLSQTWNTAGTPTAISLNVTDTASNGGNLLALRVGGANRFSVDKSGIVLASSTIVAAASLQATAGNIQVQSAAATIGWQPGGTWDLTLFRDAANILAQRNGINSQTLRVYNTFTDASNYERGKFAWESNVLRIGTENLGTGTTRNLELQASGTTYLTVRTDGHVELPLASRLTWGAGTGTDGVRLRRNGFGLLECVNLLENQHASFGAGQFRLASETFIERDAAYILALRNGVNPFSFRVYNTFTDASNYERAKIAWESNVLRIGTEKLGTGSARALELQTDGQTRLTIATTGQVQTTWGFTVGTTLQVGSGGNILRTNSTRIEARNATDSAYQNIAGLSLMTTAPDVGSNATPANSNLELRFFNVAYLAGMMRGRGRASNVSFGDVILAANPDVSVVDGSNLSDDFVVKGNTGNVEVNRGRLNVAAATTSRASLNIPSGSDPTSPNDGDIWQAGNLLKTRLNGRTQTLSYQITSGTAAPTGGSDGDIYLQYI